MPVVQLYRHGLTAGTPPGVNAHRRAIRGEVLGWSPSSIRSNTEFLYGVDERELHGVGLAVTLTVRDCPESAERWKSMRRSWEWSLRRLGLI